VVSYRCRAAVSASLDECGGSVVDRSLEQLAADRGITICFTDLDGAEGLWVPEERTILLSRTLSAKRAADVLGHELGHVDIEDGHAVLDAATHRHGGVARWVATAAAVIALTLWGGMQLQSAPRATFVDRQVPQVAVAPTPTSAPRGGEPVPTSTLNGGRGVGPVYSRTATATATPTATPTASLTPTPSVSRGPGGLPTASGTPTATPTSTAPPATTSPAPTVTPTPEVTDTPTPTAPVVNTAGAAGTTP
jgi:hypothetical protein